MPILSAAGLKNCEDISAMKIVLVEKKLLVPNGVLFLLSFEKGAKEFCSTCTFYC